MFASPRPRASVGVFCCALHAVGCARPPAPTAGAGAPARDTIELVESAPTETTLGHPDLRDAKDVWPEMIDSARTTLDLAQFYVSDAPGGRLGRVLSAIEAAADRGVRVRVLVEKIFTSKYPESLERLRRRANVELRIFDLRAVDPKRTGILHAKYFVIDGRSVFVGSQNFDWRALEHIQEMGVRIESPALGKQLGALFAADWDVAGGAPASRWATAWSAPSTTTADGLRVELAASPASALPDEGTWDLPRLVARIDAATKAVDVQLLTYSIEMRSGAPFRTLDDALRRAAARGVRVRLLVSHWGTKVPGLAELAKALPAPSAVRVITIPPASAGEIPFARVAHAKYAVFDRERVWVGTSNWEGDYFLESRNVSVFVEGASLATRLGGVFDDGWSSAYSAPLP